MPNKDKAIAADQNRASQATWREVQREKKRILAVWGEHNTLHITKMEDGGFRIGISQTPVEGERVTREMAELCGMDSDTFVQTILGEVLAQEAGTWKPVSKERQELAKLRAETAELREKLRMAGMLEGQ